VRGHHGRAVGFIERKRFAAIENPHTALLLQRRAGAQGPQGKAAAFRLEGKPVTGVKAQRVAYLLGNDNPACLIDGNDHQMAYYPI
jgi:hypothetical protein